MKESKFIELLNLYVDQEISAADAAALEAEIARSAERRRVYQQYCRMSRASTLLFEQFHTQSAPVCPGKLAEAAKQADEKVIAFPGGAVAARRPAAGWYMAAGFAAIAACAGFVLLRPAPQPGALAEVTRDPAPAVASQPAAVKRVAPVRSESVSGGEFQPVFAVFMTDRKASAETPATFTADAASLDWVQDVKLTPLRLTALPAVNAEPAPVVPADLQILQRNAQGEVEFTAFQFQR